MPNPDLWLEFEDPATGTAGQFAHGFLNAPGVAQVYATTPDSAALSITGDITIDVLVSLPNWAAPTVAADLVAKLATAGQKSYAVRIATSGKPTFFWSADGTAVSSTVATVATGLAAGATSWVRFTKQASDGATKFYTSPDRTTWTQVGTTVTDGATSIKDGTDALLFGTQVVGGSSTNRISRVVITNGYDGAGSVVVDANFAAQPIGTTSFTEASTNAATITINGAIAADSSGNLRDGRAVGGVTFGVTGKRGKCVTLNGSTGYIRIARWALSAGAGSGAAWINPAAIGSKLSILSQTTGGTSAGGFDFYVTAAGKLECKIYDNTPTASTITGGTTLSAGTWYHVAWTYDGSSLRLYLNGAEDATAVSVASTLTASLIDMLVGAQNPTTPASFFNGSIDDVRHYAAAITAADVVAAMSGIPQRSPRMGMGLGVGL